MPEDLKLSHTGSSQLPPPFRGLHSPGVRKHCQIIFACYIRKSSIIIIHHHNDSYHHPLAKWPKTLSQAIWPVLRCPSTVYTCEKIESLFVLNTRYQVWAHHTENNAKTVYVHIYVFRLLFFTVKNSENISDKINIFIDMSFVRK